MLSLSRISHLHIQLNVELGEALHILRNRHEAYRTRDTSTLRSSSRDSLLPCPRTTRGRGGEGRAEGEGAGGLNIPRDQPPHPTPPGCGSRSNTQDPTAASPHPLSLLGELGLRRGARGGRGREGGELINSLFVAQRTPVGSAFLAAPCTREPHGTKSWPFYREYSARWKIDDFVASLKKWVLRRPRPHGGPSSNSMRETKLHPPMEGMHVSSPQVT